jgi:D-glucosaminate-6-phosphate ammonia-lyase
MFWNFLDRRRFLSGLGGLPLLGAASAQGAARTASGPRDVATELGVPAFVNAAGTYTTLTASLMPPEVMAAMQVASTKYVRLNDLHDAVGKRIAERLQCEAALVSAGCASALSQATAACVAGKDRDKIQRIPDTRGMKTEVICQKSHRNGYDHAIRNAGVEMIEVETAAQFERAVSHRTAMSFFFNAAEPKGQIGLEEFVALSKKHEIPSLIDAAADVPPVENLFRFQKIGFDLVAFSGGKGLRGPQSAGLLLGRKDLIEAARLNASPNSDSLCRTNKVNKEELAGMLVALEMFLDRDHKAQWKAWENSCEDIAKTVRKVKTVKAEIVVPEIANAVPHLHIVWDHKALGKTPADLHRRMRDGSPSIELRPGVDEGVTVAVWMMQDGDEDVVARRLVEELSKA